MRAGTPASAAELVSLAASQIDEADKGALVVAWCAFRAFEHSPDEYRLVAELTPESRLEAMAHVLFRGPINPFVAHTWALDGDASWRLARSESDHALADARMGAIAVAAGARAEGEAMVAHALGLTTRLSDSEQAAAAYAVVLGAAASTGIGPWLAAVETLTNDRRILRSRRAFLVARAAAVRTLARAAAAAAGPPPSGGATVATAPRRDPYVESALDRGQTALKEACRRVPERWLDLLQRTTAAALFSRIEGRSIEVQLAEIVDWLRLEWPAPIAEIALDECLARLALAAPDRVVPIGRQLAVPRSGVVRTHARALWLARAVPCLCADRMVQADSLTQAAAR